MQTKADWSDKPRSLFKVLSPGETGKRLFDFVCAMLGLVVLTPLILAIAILVKLDSTGPVFHRGVRVGKDGKLFRMIKFRTMVANADQMGGPSTADNDSRITRAGHFLRRYKLDELPQLINVLKGEMSIVGPRPEVPEYVALMTDEEKEILSVRPGMTDWASIWNSNEGGALAGSDDPEKTYLEKIRPEKIRLQLAYVRRRSFWIDLRIIWSTFVELLRPSEGRRVPWARRLHR